MATQRKAKVLKEITPGIASLIYWARRFEGMKPRFDQYNRVLAHPNRDQVAADVWGIRVVDLERWQRETAQEYEHVLQKMCEAVQTIRDEHHTAHVRRGKRGWRSHLKWLEEVNK